MSICLHVLRSPYRTFWGRWVGVEKVNSSSQLPISIYRPKDPIPSGWFWIGHSANSSKALLVKPTLPYKAGRNPALTGAHAGEGLTDQPFVDLPRYQFLSTYFGGFIYNAPPGSLLRGLRPDMGLPGRYEMVSPSVHYNYMRIVTQIFSIISL